MKKLVFVAATLLLAACSSNPKETTTVTDSTAIDSVSVDTILVDSTAIDTTILDTSISE